MKGPRLAVGIVVMGIVVPLSLWILLHLQSIGSVLIVAATCICGWAVAEVMASILERPRLKGSSPAAAIREWEKDRIA